MFAAFVEVALARAAVAEVGERARVGAVELLAQGVADRVRDLRGDGMQIGPNRVARGS